VTATISTNGRIGEVLPVTYAEMLFTIVIMVLNLTIYSYVLGEVAAAVMKQDEDIVKQRQNILGVESYCASRSLPDDLSTQIHAHFVGLAESAVTNPNESDGSGGVQDIFHQLSHSLQVEVSSYLSRDLIGSCMVFKDSDDIFLDSMAVLLREVNMSSDQYLYRVNEISKEIFLISSGILELTVENVVEGGDSVTSIRQRGELCGELSFFFGIRQSTNARTSSTSTASFFCLAKEDYLQLLKLYPEEEDNLTRNALATSDDFLFNTKDGQSSHAGTSSYSADKSNKPGGSSAAASEVSSMCASNVDTNALDDVATVRKVLTVARRKKLNEKIVSVITAAANNDISEVSRMLTQGDISSDAADTEERTSLHLAASNGHLKMVKHLVQIHGADVSVKDRFGGTPMVDAIRHKHDACAAFLRTQGARLEVDDAAMQLCGAAAKNDVAVLRRLVENHVNPNLMDHGKRTAVHLAASEGCIEALTFLVSIKGIILSSEDRLGGTPLSDAIRHNHPAAQKLLRDHGATLGSMDVSARLCEAGALNDLNSLKILVRNGAELNVGDCDRRTALHLAASMGHLSVVSWILDKGVDVDVNVLDRKRCTPLDNALRGEHKVCALLLEERGGLRSADPGIDKEWASLVVRMNEQKSKAEKVLVVRAVQETEEVASQVDIDRILEGVQVTTDALWLNLAMLFTHLWTVTKLTFVCNNEAGFETLKADGYGNVPPDQLVAQIQESIDIIRKLMTDNVQGAITTLATFLSDPVVMRAAKDQRLVLLGAKGLPELLTTGKTKLVLLTALVSDLKEECEMNNYSLTRLTREVKREINTRISGKKESQTIKPQPHWVQAKNKVRLVSELSL